MTVHRGGKGEYLKMHLDFTEPGVLQVDMSKYIDEIIEDFPEEVNKSSPSPHTDALFKIKEEEDAMILPEEQAVQFHHTTAQVLFLATRAWKDIQTSMSFLKIL